MLRLRDWMMALVVSLMAFFAVGDAMKSDEATPCHETGQECPDSPNDRAYGLSDPSG